MMTRSGNVKSPAEEKLLNTDDIDPRAIQNLKINETYMARQSYVAKEQSEISVFEGDELIITSIEESHWVMVTNPRTNEKGLVPSNFIIHFTSIVRTVRVVKKKKNYSGVKEIFITIMCIAVAVIAYFVWPNYQQKPYCNVTCEVNQLESRFKGQPVDLWITLESCLQVAVNGNRPCIITLLNGGDSDEQTCLHREIGGAAWRLFNNSGDNLIHHKGSDLKKNGFSFDHCKSQLKEQKIMLVSEMENIPGEELNKFHSLCDVHDAAVSDAVIIFMLNFKDIQIDLPANSNDNTLAVELMHEHLKHSLHHDLIDPLVIRITEHVVKLNSGNPIKC